MFLDRHGYQLFLTKFFLKKKETSDIDYSSYRLLSKNNQSKIYL